MGPKQILRGQPWHVRTQWWALTILLILAISPLLLVALLNPFWFRVPFFEWVEDLASSLRRWRDDVMKPQLNKYKLFDFLKDNV